MKKLIVFAFVLLFQNLNSQQSTLNWHTDLNKAVNISINEKKPIMLFFTGSDWCGWCMRLKKEVFNFPEFETWTKENVVLVELDFPRRKAIDPKILNQNRELARIFGVSGYPTVWFVNPQKLDSNKLNFLKLGKLGYLAGGPSKWIATAENFLISN
ncbi:MAG: thioredoxin family protein [Flavobacteriales bacterium]|jgi:protein disulfide-isomerase|nr:thioredoxin family protein [Flavobacteriales bacterium]